MEYVPQSLEEQGFPNIVITPEPDTFHDLPWAGDGKFRIGEVLCEPKWQEPEKYLDAGPRYVARTQLEKLNALGLTVFSAFEMEFMLFKHNTQIPVFEGQDYCCNYTMSEFESFFCELDSNLTATGLNIECLHSEHAPGQFEGVIIPAYGIKGADDAFYFKQGIKELARAAGMDANFMAKPNPKEAGSGTHYNFSLWNIKSGKMLSMTQMVQTDCLKMLDISLEA